MSVPSSSSRPSRLPWSNRPNRPDRSSRPDRSNRTGVAPLWRAPLRIRLGLGAAVACLVVRLLEVIALLISPEGIPGWLPAARSWTYLWVILGWLVSSAVMLCARHWLGAVSAAWLFIMSSIGSVSLLKRGHAILGTLELVVCAVGLGGLLLAVAAGAFRRRGGETR